MKRVEGYKNLYRNESGAIVNTDKKSYEAYKAKRKASLDKEKELKDLKSEINELKELVNQLLNK